MAFSLQVAERPRSPRRRRDVVPDVDHALPYASWLSAPDGHGLTIHRDLLPLGTAESHPIRAGRVGKVTAAGNDNAGRLPGNAETGRLEAFRNELPDGRLSNDGRTARREHGRVVGPEGHDPVGIAPLGRLRPLRVQAQNLRRRIARAA